VFKERPDGSQEFDDAVALVERLRANDSYAQTLAENALQFGQKYLSKEVSLIYLREVLLAYKGLFKEKEMDEYVQAVSSTDSSALFKQHVSEWQRPWRSLTA